MFPFSRRLALRTVFNTRPSFFSTFRPPVSKTSRYVPSRGGIVFAAFAAGTVVTLAYQPIVHLDAASPSVSQQEPTRLDPDTSIAFPTTLIIPSRIRLPPFTLIGVGVRRVSFLGVKVYSVAFYADMSNPALNVPLIPTNATPEEKIRYIVSNTACVMRIVPTRATSYSHLRDGFMRAIQGHIALCFKRGTLTEAEAESTQSPLRKFQSMFPTTPLAKHQPLDILLMAPPKDPSAQRSLVVRDLGSIESNWVATEFFMAYFEGNGLSPPMKNSVIDALQNSPQQAQ